MRSVKEHVGHSKKSLAAEYIARYNAVAAPTTIPGFFNKVIEHGAGEGMWVKTIDGKRALIADSNLGVSPLGDNHPKLVEFCRMNPRLFVNGSDPSGRHFVMRNIDAGWKKYEELSPALLGEMLIALAYPDDPPGKHMAIYGIEGGPLGERVYKFLLRVNFARYLCLRPIMAFHGRFWPFLTRSNPVQEEYTLPSGVAKDIFYPLSMREVELTLELLETMPKRNIGSLWLEGIQGEGGMSHPDPAAMHMLVQTLREEIPGLQVVFDEIQTFARTGNGKWFSYEHYEVKPDIVLVGKSFGLPLGVAIVPKRKLPKGWHGGTFPGYAAGVASAIVILDIIKEEKLIEHAAKMGAYLAEKLSQFIFNYTFNRGSPLALGLTGRGLMRGLRFFNDDGVPYPEWRDETLKALIEDYVFTTSAGVPKLNPTIRIMPALNVDELTIDFLVEKLACAVKVGLARAEEKKKKKSVH